MKFKFANSRNPTPTTECISKESGGDPFFVKIVLGFKACVMQVGSTAAILQGKPKGSRTPLQIQMLLGRRVELVGEVRSMIH